MNHLGVVVVEDEDLARSYLVELLHAAGAHVVAAVADRPAAEAFFDAADGQDAGVQAVFVDVRLHGEDAGLGLVAWLRERHPHLRAVLATASAVHGSAAFDLDVVDYLEKPFTAERVERALLRLAQHIAPSHRPQHRKIAARSKREIVFLSPAEIWAIEANGRLCFVHCARGVFDVDISLAAFEAGLPEFLRIHRNWLANTALVQAMTRDGGEVQLIVGAKTLPVARDRQARVRQALLENTVGLRRV